MAGVFLSSDLAGNWPPTNVKGEGKYLSIGEKFINRFSADRRLLLIFEDLESRGVRFPAHLHCCALDRLGEDSHNSLREYEAKELRPDDSHESPGRLKATEPIPVRQNRIFLRRLVRSTSRQRVSPSILIWNSMIFFNVS